MKVGDLVRHMFDGRWDEVGVVVKINPRVMGVPGGMVDVLWGVEQSHSNNRLYRMRDLEVINESR